MSLNIHSPDVFQDDADFLKAMGHPVRLCILHYLSTTETSNVRLMQECMSIPQSTLSQHLSILRYAGIVIGRRNGNQINYRISDQRAKQILHFFKNKQDF